MELESQDNRVFDEYEAIDTEEDDAEEDENEDESNEEHVAGKSSICFSDYIESTEKYSSCYHSLELVRSKYGKNL